jgi:hypothetical protein
VGAVHRLSVIKLSLSLTKLHAFKVYGGVEVLVHAFVIFGICQRTQPEDEEEEGEEEES